MEKSLITLKNTRFTSYGPNIIRMEYSPKSAFEDNPSIRTLYKPQHTEFTNYTHNKNIHHFSTEQLVLHYKETEKGFTKETIRIETKSGELIWTYGDMDNQNLGGVHLGMDCIQRGMIPSGVHQANSTYHTNSTEYHLWNYMFGNDSVDSDAHYDGEMLTIEQLLAIKQIEDMPPKLQKIIKERQKYPPGILSRNGYFIYDDSGKAIIKDDWIENRESPDNLDLYLFYYGDNYKLGLQLYKEIFGTTPLIPKYSLGLWYSRYPTFSDTELKELIEKFHTLELPLDVLVIDMEWHKRGWFGYDWDRSHFQDPENFLNYLKTENIHTTFNVHPNGIPYNDSTFETFIKDAEITLEKDTLYTDSDTFQDFDFANKKHADSFMKNIIEPLQKQGIDFWWIDGDVPAKTIDVEDQLWTNEVYQRSIKQNFSDRRSMIFSRTGGLGTHRYPFHFTGDTYSQWEVLKNQVEYTLRAGFIGQSFITHDIGGHMSNFHYIDPELYCRWVQFGVLSPVFRLHSSGGGERRPWEYGYHVLNSFKVAIKWRMELLPYLYSMAYKSHRDLIPMCRAVILEHPEWEEGYNVWDSYYLGDNIFATPQLTPGSYREVLLPKGLWYDTRNNSLIESSGKSKTIEIFHEHKVPPHYIKAGTILIKQPYTLRASDNPEELIIEVYPSYNKNSYTFDLYEDDGITQMYKKAQSVITTFALIESVNGFSLSIINIKGSYPKHPKRRVYTIKFMGDKSLNNNDTTFKMETDRYFTFKATYI